MTSCLKTTLIAVLPLAGLLTSCRSATPEVDSVRPNESLPCECVVFASVTHPSEIGVMRLSANLRNRTAASTTRGLLFCLIVENLDNRANGALPTHFKEATAVIRTPGVRTSLSAPPSWASPEAASNTSRGGTESHFWVFSWLIPSPPAAREVSIDVQLGSVVYRFELPRGITVGAGPPRSLATLGGEAIATDSPTKTGQVARDVRWGSVSYSMPNRPAGGRSSVLTVNRSDAPTFECVLEMAIPTNEDGDPIEQDDRLRSAKAALELTDANGVVTGGREVSVRLVKDGLFRELKYVFPNLPSAPNDSGTFTVRIGDESSSVSVPSSIYGEPRIPDHRPE